MYVMNDCRLIIRFHEILNSFIRRTLSIYELVLKFYEPIFVFYERILRFIIHLLNFISHFSLFISRLFKIYEPIKKTNT
ncbi:hypothetical protein C0971_04925 [Bacillus methanolicus]|nr:hypothetical protein C0971_04925 [Bacillus methanolicus]